MGKRVLLAAFRHETNTFSKLPTDEAAYIARGLYRRGEIAQRMNGTATEMGTFLEAARRYGWDVVHPIYANATPGGKVTRQVHDMVTSEILAALQGDGPFDGILLSLHGAMVCEHADDGEGALLEAIRSAVGTQIPIAATLDLHANVTDAMARLCDIMVSYRTYPHIDAVETATLATELLERTMAGEIRPKIHVARGAMLDGVDHGRTTAPGPMLDVLAAADKLKAQTPDVLAVSINAGFPWVDIAETGPTALVVADQNRTGVNGAAEAMASKLIDEIWRRRTQVTIETVTSEDAMAAIRAAGPVKAPIVLADFADNPGGGGYGDATRLLTAMLLAELDNACFGTLYDPEAARLCYDAGLGTTVTVNLGGKVDPDISGGPIRVTGNVIAVTDGSFRMQGPMMKGALIQMGPTAVLSVGGIDIVITSRRYQVYDLKFFQHAGLDPRKKSVVAVKSAHHFRAAFAPIAHSILVVDDGGGLTSRNYRDLPYEKVRRPVFPLDMD